jgi:hypothetical protein
MFLTADEVSRLYDMQSILGTNRRKLVCPFPDHKHVNYTPSFSIFFSDGKQRFRCHGCGRMGDVIDLVGYMNIPSYSHDNPEKVKLAINLLTGGRYSIQPVIAPPPEPQAIYQGEWKSYLPPREEALRYIELRGISDVGKIHCLGQLDEANAKYLTIPCFHDEILQGIKLRLIDGNGARYKAIKGSKAGLFNHDGILHVTGTVFVVKGEIAAMVMESYAYYACAPTNGESGDITPFMSAFSNASRIVVIGDNDAHENKQVMESTKRRARALGADLIFPPDRFKDIDEWLLESPDSAQVTLNQYI